MQKHTEDITRLLDLCYGTGPGRGRVRRLLTKLIRDAEARGFSQWEFVGVRFSGRYGELPVVLGTCNIAGNAFTIISGDLSRTVVTYRLGVRARRWDIAALVLGR
jgi:hypothetical protein